MNLFNAILIGLKEVWAHKFRSLLTLFGVVLGVASLVGMSAIIKGMENGMRESMIAMGGADKVILQRQAVPAKLLHILRDWLACLPGKPWRPARPFLVKSPAITGRPA